MKKNKKKLNPDPPANWIITDSENNVGWKKYTNSEIGIEFEYPESLMKDVKNGCPLRIYILAYEELPNQVDGICYFPCTKSDFLKEKNDFEAKNIPSAEEIKFINLDGRNALQKIYYGAEGGSHMLSTEVYSANSKVTFLLILPIAIIMKEKPVNIGDQEYKEADIPKNEEKIKEVQRGIYSPEVKKVIDDYNKMLSTFKYTP